MRQVLVRRQIARLAVVPLAAALLLGGCGRPGTAAIVDGERITDGQVSALVDDLSLLSASAVPPANALGAMIAAPAVLGAVTDAGAGVSEQQARALLDDTAEQLQLEPWDYSDEVVQYARLSLASSALGQNPAAAEAVQAAVADLDVEVNPRFGTWSAGAIEATSWPWLIPSAS